MHIQQTKNSRLRFPRCFATTMDSQVTYASSSSFSIDNILRDKKHEPESNFQLEYKHRDTAECLRHESIPTSTKLLFSSPNPWSPYQTSHGCALFNKSRKATGMFGNVISVAFITLSFYDLNFIEIAQLIFNSCRIFLT